MKLPTEISASLGAACEAAGNSGLYAGWDLA
jgi:hypothetical protein